MLKKKKNKAEDLLQATSFFSRKILSLNSKYILINLENLTFGPIQIINNNDRSE